MLLRLMTEAGVRCRLSVLRLKVLGRKGEPSAKREKGNIRPPARHPGLEKS